MEHGAEDYRTDFPTDTKELWKKVSGAPISSKTNSTEDKPAASVKLVDPPVKLNGGVDLVIVGLWKCKVDEIDYYLDFKTDGTYDTNILIIFGISKTYEG